MKQLIVLFLLFPFLSNTQITDVKERDSCYFNYDNKGNRIKNMRGYAEWECGKLAGVIDCNEELSYDEANDLVLRQPKDMVNMAGAGKPFSGKCEMCFMNGKLQRRVTFLSGKENGIDTSYYQSGCPQVVRSHMQGVQTGTWTYYYDSTNYLAWEMNYYLGEKHGKHIFFTRDGDTTLWEVYQNGLLHGTKREYFEDSKIQKEVDYKNGIFDGFFKVYNEEGVIIEELKYKEGKRDGEAKYYYDDGTLLRTESWTLGVKNGSFKTFFYNGDVQVSENYKKGRMEGWFEEYHPGNIAKRRAKYEKDILVEEHKYDEHGRETYSFGAPTGNQNEDDDAPVEVGKKKKEKKKKEKKKKEKKNKSK